MANLINILINQVYTMRYFSINKYSNVILLVSRILLMLLFVIFGLEKLTGFKNTVTFLTYINSPFPILTAIIAVVMEFFVGMAILAGFYTRPLTLIMAAYTLATALICHDFWTMGGEVYYANEIHFYKNMAIAGGLILLALTGPGNYSLDRE